MDFAIYDRLKVDDPFEINVYDPAGFAHVDENGVKLKLKVLSPESPKFIERRDELRKAYRDKVQYRDPSPKDARDYATAMIAASVIGWVGHWELDGETLEYSEENAFKLLDRVAILREQVAAWIDDRGKVWLASKPKSSNGASGEAGSTEDPKSRKRQSGKNTEPFSDKAES